MRAQSSLLIVMAVITIMMTGWIFTLYSQMSVQNLGLTEIPLTKISKHLDMIKGFSKNALILSTHRATSAVGAEGITFYCLAPTPPTTKQIRYDLSNKTVNFLNAYISNYDVPDPTITFNIDKFSCVDNPIDYELSSEKYDENFTSNAYGSKIKISVMENNVSSTNDFYELISENRFWFLYRKLNDWALYKGREFEKRICSCLNKYSHSCPAEISSIGCEECPELSRCLREQIDITAQDMTQYFEDKFIDCVGSPTCCYGKRGDPCQNRDSGCPFWVGNKCSQCNILKDDNLCVENIKGSEIDVSSSLQGNKNELGFEDYSDGIFLSQFVSSDNYSLSGDEEEVCGNTCVFWETGYITLKTLFTCTDKKYDISIPPLGDRYLKFSIDTVISAKRSGINPQSYDCTGTLQDCHCPSNMPAVCQASCGPVPKPAPTPTPPTTPTPTPPTTPGPGPGEPKPPSDNIPD
jgi:hypothetical protein